MATRSIGDLKGSNGHPSLEDPTASVAPHADLPRRGASAAANELNELGQKIFLDRYAMKDMHKRTLSAGDMVIVCVDDKTGQREIAAVQAIEGSRVRVELRDGVQLECLIEHVSKPIETDPEQMMERVARGIAAVEGEQADDWYHKFRWLLEGWKFVPAGRILTAAGTDQQLTFYNCYVVPSPKDSRRGIVDTLSQMMEIMSRGGGVGINVSSLRPRYSYVKGVNGRSSGAVSWGALYSFVTGLIEQGGSRRGALMLILNCWHPDVIEFINAKREMGKITNANISVGITDKFMQAVEADADWDLVFADTSDPDYETMWDGNLDKWLAAGKKTVTHKTVKARQIWDAIIESAWASAEPGVFFIERANRMSNSWYYDSGYLGCTNPCLTGDALVSTPDGWKRADSISEGDWIGTVLGRGIVETVESHERVPVFKVILSDGATLRATAAHQFHAIRRQDRSADRPANKRFTPTRLDQLRVGDYVRIAPALMPDNPVPGKPASWLDREYGFMIGILLGDGCYTEKNLARHSVTVACDARETEWVDLVEGMMRRAGAPAVNRYQNRDSRGRMTNSLTLASQARYGLAGFVSSTLLSPSISAEKDIPLEYVNTNREFLAGLLDGLWSTDGDVNLKSTHPSLRFKTSSEKLAQSVRRILLMFGIHGRIIKGTRARHEIDGHSINESLPFFEVVISGAGVRSFAEQIGITHPKKADQLKQARLSFALTGNTWMARIVSIEPCGEEAVYDLYERESDTWIAEGVVNRGCGEQPLPGFGVCNLGAINLSKFVRDGEVLWDELGKTVRYSVRFLDDVIDATPYFFEENYAQQKSERRVGLNTMGLAEMLIRLGIRYGSD
ncbi:MAG TPA: LAGLIDADG family homing endonuclease, partial [Blastocatellia bacterium]|nr:LAGLIDADG family homing endonuclease [Blastocatellia bacterium]